MWSERFMATKIPAGSNSAIHVSSLWLLRELQRQLANTLTRDLPGRPEV
jgi:hypothetical protein